MTDDNTTPTPQTSLADGDFSPPPLAGDPTMPSGGGSSKASPDGVETPAAGEGGTPAPAVGLDDEGQQTFDRAYVVKLRESEARYRVRAKHAETLAQNLVEAYAAATGLLADPTDLRFDPSLLDDDGVPDRVKVEQAVAMLLDRKPHLASRTPRGDVGQGARPGEAAGVSLAGLLRAGAV